MALVLTSAPAVEPVSLAEAKAHLRVDGTAEDPLIQSLVITSRLHIEAALGLALVTQSWLWTLDRWPRTRTVVLPLRPVVSIDQVRVWDAEDAAQAIDPATYLLDGHGKPARLAWRDGVVPAAPLRPINGIEIAFTAGFGAAASDVPAPVRQALLMLVAHWYEHREPIEIGSSATAIPQTVSDLLLPYRGARL